MSKSNFLLICHFSYVGSQRTFGGSIFKQASRVSGDSIFARPRAPPPPPMQKDTEMPMETDNMMDDISPYDSVSNWGDEMEQSFESSKESDNKVTCFNHNFYKGLWVIRTAYRIKTRIRFIR